MFTIILLHNIFFKSRDIRSSYGQYICFYIFVCLKYYNNFTKPHLSLRKKILQNNIYFVLCNWLLGYNLILE